jgi:hypothetical protein
MIGQYFVVTFQATFALAAIFSRLRWIYLPVGLGFHVANMGGLQKICATGR